jgi:hypothetical protein
MHRKNVLELIEELLTDVPVPSVGIWTGQSGTVPDLEQEDVMSLDNCPN